jgi:predicted 2-oxoglutarate/Fe(II)-dependent dioxygenase YbiX
MSLHRSISSQAESSQSHTAPALPASVLADLSSPAPFGGLQFSFLGAGDLAPDWTLETLEGEPFSFCTDAVAGKIRVLLSVGALDTASSLLQEYEALAHRLVQQGASVFVAYRKGDAPIRTLGLIRALVDKNGEVAASFGSAPGSTKLVVLRANQHIALVETCEDHAQCFDAAWAVCERLQMDRGPNAMASHPPLLIVPDVFSASECRKLIDVFNTRGQVLVQADKAIDYFSADYKMQAPDQMRQDRLDHFFFEKSTINFLLHRLVRVELEVAKAFHYRITKHETLRVARYQGSRGGYGHGHRDNIPPHQHRRFALSINLNAEEYEGGDLRFPEFGEQLFRPPAGTAFVFSSSLLHEATQVTSGTRYVLLSFMYGDT